MRRVLVALCIMGALTLNVFLSAFAQTSTWGWGPGLNPALPMHIEGQEVYACAKRDDFVKAFNTAEGRPGNCPHLIPGDRITLLSSTKEQEFVQIKVLHMNGKIENLWIATLLLYNDVPGWRSP